MCFDRSVNPDRGCEHGCIDCFARPSHAYHDLSPGLDFESRLFAKPDAPPLLREALAKRGYAVRPIAFGAHTDPYQPIDGTCKITRGCIDMLAQTRHTLTVTKIGRASYRERVCHYVQTSDAAAALQNNSKSSPT